MFLEERAEGLKIEPSNVHWDDHSILVRFSLFLEVLHIQIANILLSHFLGSKPYNPDPGEKRDLHLNRVCAVIINRCVTGLLGLPSLLILSCKNVPRNNPMLQSLRPWDVR